MTELPADLLEAIAAVESHRVARKEFEDRFLLNGFLCITQEQYAAIKRMGNERWDALVSPPPTGGIPVLVLKAGEVRELGDGRIAVNLGGTIYALSSQQRTHSGRYSSSIPIQFPGEDRG